MATAPDPRIDTVREQLRALGYLDARVDRFVLGDAAARGRGLALAAAASARIGLLAGVLLGPAAVVGVAARVDGFVTSVTDALVLALYLAVLFGLATAVLACGAILIAGALARRWSADAAFPRHARRAAIAAGLLVAAACLGYLTLWWRAAVPPGAWATQGLALAVATAISVLLGHVVTISVLAYLVAATRTQANVAFAESLPQGSPLSSWRVVVPMGVVALTGALVLLAVITPSTPPPAAPPPLAVVPTGARVVVLAIDGVDVATLDRLRTTPSLPTFQRLLAQARAPLTSDADRDPAQVWTTIATGQPPDRHGVRALESRQLAGVEGRMRSASPGVAPGLAMLTTATDLLRLTRPTIASGEERRLPAFWEVGASAGIRTAVVHWWATWPASDTQGVVLSDRAILRLEQDGTLAGEIAPAAVYDQLRQTADARHARVAALADIATSALPAGVAAIVTRSATLDATILELATDPALGPLDLLTVYLPGLDIAQHALFPLDATTPLAPAAAAERLQALEVYYRFLDTALSRTVLRDDDAQRMVLLVAQPGRLQQDAPGLLAISGANAATIEADRGAPVSIAPTVLMALGIPVAADLAGTPAAALFTERFRAAHPARTVPTYGERRVSPRTTAGQPLDREMIERMRSLGYVR